MLQALLRLKAMVRGARCAAVVSVPGSLFEPSDLARMQHIADGVISLESVADDSDLARWVRSACEGVCPKGGGACLPAHQSCCTV